MRVFTRVFMGKVHSPRVGVLAGALQHTGLCNPPLPETCRCIASPWLLSYSTAALFYSSVVLPQLHFEASTKDKNFKKISLTVVNKNSF